VRVGCEVARGWWSGGVGGFLQNECEGTSGGPPGSADCAPILAACWARSIMISTVRAVAVSGGAAEGPPEAAKALERVSGPAAERASGWPRSEPEKERPPARRLQSQDWVSRQREPLKTVIGTEKPFPCIGNHTAASRWKRRSVAR